MSRDKDPDLPLNVVKMPSVVKKVTAPVVDDTGQHRLTEISKGGWSSWEHMTTDLLYSIVNGDLEPVGMAVIVFDKNIGTLLLRRDVSPLGLRVFLQEYLETDDE